MSNNNAPGMTVEEGNRLIAEFMGASCPKLDNTVMAFILSGERFPDNMYRCKIVDLKYHSSWDWIMPVAEKIVNMTPIKGIVIQFTNMKEGVVDALIRADRAKIWASCVQFIQWYNTQTPQP